MRVYIDQQVHWRIEDFYENALLNHAAFDEMTAIKKIHRLYDALERLGTYAHIYPTARLNEEWKAKGYREFICENFHFAFQIYALEDGTEIVRIHDAVHSLFMCKCLEIIVWLLLTINSFCFGGISPLDCAVWTPRFYTSSI